MKRIRLISALLVMLTMLSILMGCADNMQKNNAAGNTTTTTPSDNSSDQLQATTERMVIQGYGAYTLQPEPDFPGCALKPSYLRFDSLGEMKFAFVNHELSTSDAATIRRAFSQNEKGEYIVPDMNNLYSPVMPDGCDISGIDLCSDYYYFYLELGKDGDLSGGESDGIPWGFINIYTFEERYEADYENDHTDFSEYEEPQITHVDDRDAEVLTFASQSKIIQYTITTPEKTLMVEEKYPAPSEDESIPTSETVPYEIRVWGEEGDLRYALHLYDFTERPSLEWITSIGVEKYVEPTDTVKQ